MLGRQLRQYRHQPLVERRRVQIGHQHHQRTPADASLHGGHHRGGVRLHQRGLQRGHRIHQLCEQLGARRVEHARPVHPVVGEEVDMVAGPRRQRGQQQCGVHRPVQPRPATRVGGGGVDADAARRRAAGVQDDDHPTVALGPPRAHHDVGTTRGGAPVDGSDVVADDILTQRIEFGALAADQHRDHAVQLAQLGQPRRQMLAGQERRQDADLPRHPVRALPACQAERSDRAGGDQRRPLVAAADRPQLGIHANLLPRRRYSVCGCAARPAHWAARHRGPDREIAGGPRSRSSARHRPADPAARQCRRTG